MFMVEIMDIYIYNYFMYVHQLIKSYFFLHNNHVIDSYSTTHL